MKLKMKTTITLLIAILMTSAFAVAHATEGIHLITEGDPPAGNEDTIVIPMPEDFTLDDLESISWDVYTVAGYPPHVDIILDVDGDGVIDPEDVLTVEMYYNNAEYTFGLVAWCNAHVDYDTWLKTFELTTEDEYDAVDDTSIVWLSKLGGGPGDAPSGTLAQWKAGVGAVAGPDDPDEIVPAIDGSAPVLRLEIEVDNWVINSEAFVDNIHVNGADADLLVEVLQPPIVSIMVSPTSVDFGALRPGEAAETQYVDIFNIGDVAVTITHDITGDFFIANLVVSDPGTIDPDNSGTSSLDLTVPSETVADIYTGKIVFEATPVLEP